MKAADLEIGARHRQSHLARGHQPQPTAHVQGPLHGHGLFRVGLAIVAQRQRGVGVAKGILFQLFAQDLEAHRIGEHGDATDQANGERDTQQRKKGKPPALARALKGEGKERQVAHRVIVSAFHKDEWPRTEPRNTLFYPNPHSRAKRHRDYSLFISTKLASHALDALCRRGIMGECV
jgi:hypothetical protein